MIVPRPQIKNAWATHYASALPGFIDDIRAALSPPAELGTRAGEWFTRRVQHPPIPPTVAPQLPVNPVVLLLTIDGVRADIINGEDYAERLPTFSQLKHQALWFSQAYAPGSQTKVTLTSLFMGTYFSQQYWRDHPTHLPRDDETPRFPEWLQKAGIRTVSLRALDWLRAKKGSGYIRGFDQDDHVRPAKEAKAETPAREMIESIVALLDEIADESAFVFCHLMDPHRPYDRGKVKQGPLFDRYVSEVQYVDKQLTRLLAFAKQSRRGERLFIIISSDHGEAFNEHGANAHGKKNEMIRVPLFILSPLVHPRRSDVPGGLIDLGPTILDLFRVETPGYFMGQTLMPMALGEAQPLTRPLAAEGRLKQAMIFPDGWKVIVDNRNATVELYNTREDPLETQDLSGDPGRLADRLLTLRQFFKAHALERPGYKPPFVR